MKEQVVGLENKNSVLSHYFFSLVRNRKSG